MGDVALRTRDALHQSEIVELDDRLGKVEVNGTAALAFAVENYGQISHEFEGGDESCVPFARGGIAFDDGVDGGVRHALGGTDDALGQFAAHDLTVRINLHHAGEDEPVEVRAQAADIGGEFERQHGHGTVREVNAGAAQ